MGFCCAKPLCYPTFCLCQYGEGPGVCGHLGAYLLPGGHSGLAAIILYSSILRPNPVADTTETCKHQSVTIANGHTTFHCRSALSTVVDMLAEEMLQYWCWAIHNIWRLQSDFDGTVRPGTQELVSYIMPTIRLHHLFVLFMHWIWQGNIRVAAGQMLIGQHFVWLWVWCAISIPPCLTSRPIKVCILCAASCILHYLVYHLGVSDTGPRPTPNMDCYDPFCLVKFSITFACPAAVGQ